MNDTSAGAEKKLLQMMMQKGEIEKLFMAASIFDMARSITQSAILEEMPGISPSELREELFRRWYGEDFEPKEREKIIKAYRSRDESSNLSCR
ncbi:MAG: hypothetical protein CVU90_04270 [Firmicutes bacterium HGW-Firmicutes-15]|nr:MAG: hypothetical protein CVU90_04270 [Firmicutes bacterium HGW-Firmicutes-15]